MLLRNRLSPARLIAYRLRRLFPQYAKIGRNRIRLARRSPYLEYRNRFTRYDVALGIIADLVRSKYPELCVIDVGASVGDTAAVIRTNWDIPVLCIEGDRKLLPLLRQNALDLGAGIEIEPNFLGAKGQSVDVGGVTNTGSNASLVGAVGNTAGDIKLRTLAEILVDHPIFSRAKLLKIDIEGFDFDTIQQSIDFIQDSKPIVFFEYYPRLRIDQPTAGLEAIHALESAGYSDFIYYDNYGHFMLHASVGEGKHFSELHSYLLSNERFGGAVHYFDVCAFHTDDAELAGMLRERELLRASVVRPK